MISALAARRAAAQTQKSQPTSPSVKTNGSTSNASLPDSKQQRTRQEVTEPRAKRRRTEDTPSKSTRTKTRYFEPTKVENDESEEFEVQQQPWLPPTPSEPPDPPPDGEEDVPFVGPLWSPSTSNLLPVYPSDLAQHNTPSTVCSYITLKPDESLYISGNYSVIVIAGTLTLSSVSISPESGWTNVHAPLTHALPSIQAKEDAKILICEKEGDVSVFRRLVPASGRLATAHANLTPLPGFRTLRCLTQPTYNVRPFVLLIAWGSLLSDERLSSSPAGPPSILVTGPKGVGKSTLSKLIANAWLSTGCRRVAYLGLDPGQPDFGLPGTLSLLTLTHPVMGPVYARPRLQAHRSHFIGCMTPIRNPSLYLAAVQNLVETYRMDIQFDEEGEGVPLVINTPGWSKGLGSEILKSIEGIVQPSLTVDLHPEDIVLPPASTETRVALPSVALSHSPLSSSDLRTLNLASYFHSSSSIPLSSQVPWQVPLSLFTIILVGPGTEDVVPSKLHLVLPGALVALLSSSVERTEQSYVQGAPPPSPSESTFIGLAVIRAFDHSSGLLHLLTPVPPSELAKVRVLVKGEIELPLCFWTDGLDAVTKAGEEVPYLESSRGTGVGGDRRRVRRNLMRRGQM